MKATDLETVEAPGFGGLHFTRETFEQVFVDDAIRSGEEGKNVRDEVLFEDTL